MIFKKFYLPFFVLLAVFLALQSCENKPQKKPEKKSNLVEINRLIELGEKHYKDMKYDSSYYYFNKAKSLCDVKKDTAKILYSLLNLAYIQQNQGDYSGCETTILEAFPFLKNNPKPNHHWAFYRIMGANYLQTFDYKLAFYYNNLALHLKTNKYRKACIKNNIAGIYMDMHNYKKAVQILLPLTLEKEVINDAEVFSIVLDNIGYSYYKLDDSKALAYMNHALKIRLQEKNDWGLITSYGRLSEYFKKSNPNKAFNYALLGYQKSTKINDINDRMICLALLIENSTGGKLKKFSLDYIRINDSLVKARQIAKNQFAKIKYDSKKDKEENLKLKTQKAETALELEKQKNQNLVLNFLVITGILSTIFLYYFLKAINKKEKIKTSYDTETRIAKKLHDELANDVYHTMAFAETQDLSKSQNKESLLNNLDTIYSRTRNISKENSIIDTGTKYVEGLKEMMSGFNTPAITILVNGMDSFDWQTMERNKKIIIYRIIQELLVNMKKHSQCSLAVIAFKKSENKLQIDYSDNGVGAALDKKNLKNGLQNVENRILSINGTITFDTKSNKGFKTSFIIPV